MADTLNISVQFVEAANSLTTLANQFEQKLKDKNIQVQFVDTNGSIDALVTKLKNATQTIPLNFNINTSSLQQLQTTLNNLKNMSQGGASLSLKLANPQDIQNLVNEFRNLSVALRDVGDQLQKVNASLTGNVWQHIGQNVSEANSKIEQLIQTVGKLESSLNNIGGSHGGGAGGASRQVDQLTQSEQMLAKALANANQYAQNQSRIFSDLKSMAAQYVSVWGVSNFVKEIAQVTGELELQHKSLEVILGSAQKANELYTDIRNLSQMSPYTFQDLMKSTRQLAAFGVQTKDLYGRMEALSNIGAGLSVDVQRLILAYGHTKSYGYLSGIQNRQFETAGIDMVGALADRYNRLAREAAGAGEQIDRVSRKQIFEKIKKKEISFEDVDAVLMELTRPGGKFYNMQQEQYNTLGGKLRNLRNNYNIMLSEMGQQSHGVLTGGVDILNNLTANWEKYATILRSVIITMGLTKSMQYLLNTSLTKGSRILASQFVTAGKNAAMQRNMEKIMSNQTNGLVPSKGVGWLIGRTWLGQGFFASKVPEKITGKGINTFKTKLDAAVQSGELNYKQVMRQLVLNKDLNSSYRMAAASVLKYDDAMQKTLGTSRGFALFTQKLKFNVVSLGSSLRNGVTSLLGGWPQMALMGGMYLWQRQEQETGEIRRLTEEMQKQATNDLKKSSELINRYIEDVGGVQKIFNGKGEKPNNWEDDPSKYGFEFDEEFLKGTDLTDTIEEMKQKLQALSPIWEYDLFDVEKTEDQVEQFKILLNKFKDIAEANQFLEDQKGALENILKQGDTGYGSWFRDSLSTDLKDYKTDIDDLTEGLYSMSDANIKHAAGEFDALGYDIYKLAGGRNDVNRLRQAFVELSQEIALSGKKYSQYKSELEDGYFSAFNSKVRKNIGEMHDDVLEIFNSDGSAFQIIANILSDERLADKPDLFNDVAQQIWDMLAKAMEMNIPENLAIVMMKMVANGMKDKNLANQLFVPLATKTAQDEIGSYILDHQKNLNTGGVSPEMMFIPFMSSLRKTLKDKGLDAATEVKGFMNGIRESFLTEARKFKNGGLLDWQKELIGKGNGSDTELQKSFRINFGVDVKGSTTPKEMWEKVQKRFDASKKFIESIPMEIQKQFGITLTPTMLFNVDALQKIRKQIDNLVSKAPDGYWKSFGEEAMKELDVMISGLKTANKYDHEFNGSSKARDKAAKEAAEAERKAQQARDKAESERQKKLREAEKKHREAVEDERKKLDDIINGYRERVSTIRSATELYKKYRQEMSKDAAANKVRSEYAKEFEYGIIKKGDLDDLENEAVGILDGIVKKLGGVRATYKENTEVIEHSAHNAIISTQRVINGINWDRVQQNADKFLSFMDTRINNLIDDWQIYNQVLSKTGREDIATYIAFGNKPTGVGKSGEWREYYGNNKALDYQQNILGASAPAGGSDFSKWINWLNSLSDKYNKNNEPLDDTGKAWIDFASLFQIEDKKERDDALKEEIERIKSIYGFVDEKGKPVDRYKAENERFDAMFKGISKYLDGFEPIFKEQLKESIDAFVELISMPKGLAEERELILSKYENRMNKIRSYFMDGDGNSKQFLKAQGISTTDQQKAEEIATADRDYHLLLLSDDYKRFFNALETMSAETGETVRQYLVDGFRKAFNAGIINADEYADFMKKIADQAKTNSWRKGEGKAIYERFDNLLFDPTKEKNQKEIQSMFSYIPERVQQVGENIEGSEQIGQALETLLLKMLIGSANKQDLKDAKFLAGILFGNEPPSSNDKKKAQQISSNVNNNPDVPPDEAIKKFKELIENILESLKQFKEGVDFFHDMFDSFGEEGIANALSDASTVVGSSIDGAESIGGMVSAIAPSLGPYGQAAGAALGLAMGMAKAGDAMRERKIEELKREVSKIDNTLNIIRGLREKQLGYDKGQTRKLLASMYAGSNKRSDKAMYDYYSRGGLSGSGYSQELEAMRKQREAYLKMYDEENAKKKKSKDSLEEYKSKVAEMDQQILEYTENLASELWGIDLKGWAEQFGDALMTAFENGTSAATAFKDTVKDVMRTVVKNMMITGIIEPAFDTLSENLFGKDGEGGIFDINNVEGTIGLVLDELSRFFNEDLPNRLDAAQEFYNGANDVLKQHGYSLDEADSSKNLTNSVSQTASEETMGYVAGYLATMAQDMAARRIQFDSFVNESWPNYIEMVTTANISIMAIDRNVLLIMQMMRDGEGAMYNRVDNISRRMDNITNGIDKVYTR